MLLVKKWKHSFFGCKNSRNDLSDAINRLNFCEYLNKTTPGTDNC